VAKTNSGLPGGLDLDIHWGAERCAKRKDSAAAGGPGRTEILSNTVRCKTLPMGDVVSRYGAQDCELNSGVHETHCEKEGQAFGANPWFPYW